MSTRLTSAMLVAAVVRRTNAAGGFAAVLSKGDPTAGSVLVICREGSRIVALIERLLGPEQTYGWQRVGPDPGDSLAFDEYLDRRRQRDPDLWVVELDIPDSERFAAESMPTG